MAPQNIMGHFKQKTVYDRIASSGTNSWIPSAHCLDFKQYKLWTNIKLQLIYTPSIYILPNKPITKWNRISSNNHTSHMENTALIIASYAWTAHNNRATLTESYFRYSIYMRIAHVQTCVELSKRRQTYQSPSNAHLISHTHNTRALIHTLHHISLTAPEWGGKCTTWKTSNRILSAPYVHQVTTNIHLALRPVFAILCSKQFSQQFYCEAELLRSLSSLHFVGTLTLDRNDIYRETAEHLDQQPA